MPRSLPSVAPWLATVFASLVAGMLVVDVPSAPVITAAIVVTVPLVIFVSRFLSHAPQQRERIAWTIGGGFQRGVLRLLLIALIAYQLAFNYVSNHARLQFAGVLAVGLTVLGVAMLLTAPDRRAARHVVALLGGFVIVDVVGAMSSLHGVEALVTFRQMFPLVIASGLVLRADVIPVRLAGWLLVFVSLGGSAISLGHGTHLIDDAYRLSPFTGGTDGVHSSAYVLACAAIGLNELRRQRLMPPWVVYGVIAVDGAMIYRIKVATALVMLLVYFCWRGLEGRRSLMLKAVVVATVAAVGIFAYQTRVHDRLTAAHGSRVVSLNTISSGRIGNWESRLHILDSRDAGLLLLGSGVGSDLLRIMNVWNGVPKVSHNDFLAILFDQGMLGLLGYVMLLAVLGRAAGRTSWPLIAALVVTSSLDDALYARPTVSPLFWLALGIAARGQLRATPPAPQAAGACSSAEGRGLAAPPRPAMVPFVPVLRAHRESRRTVSAAVRALVPPLASPRTRPARRRIAVGFVDQAVSSVTNFLGTIVAAKALAPAEFGHFATVGAVYVLVLVGVRGLTSEGIIVTHSAARTGVNSAMRNAAAVVVVVALTVSAVLAGSSLVLGSDLRNGMLLLAVTLPVLLIQDYLRFVSIALGRPATALALDGSWLVLQVAAIVVVQLVGTWNVAAAVSAWLLPGALSGALGALFVVRVRPQLAGVRQWVARNASMTFRFAVDNVLSQNVGVVLVLVLAVVSTSAQAGYFRVAQAAFGPLLTLSLGVRLAIIPELVRLRRRDLAGFNRLVRLSAFSLVFLSSLWGMGTWVAPIRFGRVAFGSSWATAHTLLIAMTVSVGASGIRMAAFAGIRACGDARGSLHTMMRVAVINLAAGVVGAVVDGAMGATLALAFSVPLASVLWWLQFRRSRAAPGGAIPIESQHLVATAMPLGPAT